MRDNAPPVLKLARRVMVEIEQIVSGFPRFHKYNVGDRLRRQALAVNTFASRAWRYREDRSTWIRQLSFSIDDLKETTQLAQELGAFRGFKQFEALARLLTELGQQCGGWLRQQHPKGQNSRAETPAGRAPILSARDASGEATL